MADAQIRDAQEAKEKADPFFVSSLEKAAENGIPEVMQDRLMLTATRIRQIADGVREVKALPSPLGSVESMEKLENVLSAIDYSLNTKKKRHIIGGVLMSISLLFGGLAFTVITIKTEVIKNDKGRNYGLYMAMQIIDKYKAESEDKE